MINDIERARVTRIIRQIARENRVSEAEVRADMLEAMNSGRNDPDPAVQKAWEGFCYEGEEPTLEEFILWVSGQIK